MRESLFRGKRKDNGEWVEGSLLYDTERDEAYIAEYFEDKSAYIRAVDPYTVGQYTGVTDKYSNPVFEDDIIRDEDGDIFAVFYYEFYASYCAKRIAESSALFGLQDIDIYGAKVIGNIYDNPELLEVSENDLLCHTQP